MNFFTWLTTKRKTLATMTPAELRAQEMLMQNERDRLFNQMQKLARDKQQIIEKGAKEKTPEMRRTIAQQFDLRHTEQMMVGRQLNIRSKELLTVSRLRMLRESAARAIGRPTASGVSISERDIALIGRLIENEQISSEMYQERLDEILALSHTSDEAASAGVSPAAEELLRVWDDMDAGLIKGDQAFDETERRVRERDRAADA